MRVCANIKSLNGGDGVLLGGAIHHQYIDQAMLALSASQGKKKITHFPLCLFKNQYCKHREKKTKSKLYGF